MKSERKLPGKTGWLPGLVIVVLLSFWAVRPLLSSGYFPMHDDTQVSRVIVMADALKNGQFPVRWVDGLGYGYGYPIFNFYGPLPYYFGAILNIFGLDAVTSAKLMMAAGLAAAGVFAYVAVLPFAGPAAATVSAVLYLYAPYHAVQTYVRGAVGELWAYALLPLVASALLASGKKPFSRAVLVGGLGTFGVILSHTVFAYLLGVLLSVFILVSAVLAALRRISPAVVVKSAGIALLGFSLSAFFWLPAFFEKRFTRVEGFQWDRVNLSDHFVCPSQLWSSPWGYGGSAVGCVDGMSFMAGKLHLVLFAIGLLVFVIFRKKAAVSLLSAGIILTLVSVFMVLPVSEPVWRLLPDAMYVQYPWRLLTLVALGTAVTWGGVMAAVKGKLQAVISSVILITLIIGMNAKWFRPQYVNPAGEGQYRTREDLSFRASKVSDEYLPPEVQRPGTIAEVPDRVLSHTDSVTVEYEMITETYIKAKVTPVTAGTVLVNRAYFPGWTYKIDGRKVVPVVENGLPRLTFPEGGHVFEIGFTDTPVRTIGNTLSIITVVIIMFVYGKKTYG